MKIKHSSICQAFNTTCVGSKVLHHDTFHQMLEGAIAKYQFPENGQGFILLPEGASKIVSTGDVERAFVDSYVAREWRGEVQLFADRKASVTRPPAMVAAIVYTADAYCADPEVHEGERMELVEAGATHVLVAVLASRGPKPTLSSSRFVRNLAGGNTSFAEGQKTYGELVEMAKAIVEYEATWIVVAD